MESAEVRFTGLLTMDSWTLQSLANELLSADATLKLSLQTGQQFPGFDNCYIITEIQQKYNISSGALYLLIQRQGIVKYSVGKFTCVAKQDIDIIFNAVGR